MSLPNLLASFASAFNQQQRLLTLQLGDGMSRPDADHKEPDIDKTQSKTHKYHNTEPKPQEKPIPDDEFEECIAMPNALGRQHTIEAFTSDSRSMSWFARNNVITGGLPALPLHGMDYVMRGVLLPGGGDL